MMSFPPLSDAQKRQSVVPATAVKPVAAAVAAAPAVIPPSDSRVRQVRLSLKDLGASKPLVLRGVEGDASVPLNIRLDEVVQSAKLTLNYSLSPALLPNLSHIKVFLNDEMLLAIPVVKEKLGVPQTLTVDLDPRFFVDFNRIKLQLIGHYTLECEMPSHTSLWANISNDSALDLTLRQVPLKNDLSLIPAPFFDFRDNALVDLPFVFGDLNQPEVLRASGAVASWLGAQAAYRGARFTTALGAPPKHHGIVFATNQSRPAFLKDVPPVTRPTLSIIANPAEPSGKLLLVLGQTPAEVMQAADALVLGKAVLSGQSIGLTRLETAPRRLAYDAPNWIPTRRPVRFSELVNNPGELQVRGTALNDTVRVNARVPPDLFTWNAKGIPMDLRYRYSPPANLGEAMLNVAINDEFIHSYPLLPGSSSGARSEFVLPLMDDGTVQTQTGVKIPAFYLASANQLQFSFQIPPADHGKCRSVQALEMRAAVDPDSTIDLSGYYHFAPMPNLATFANSGFPFTKYADLAETAVIMPKAPSPASVDAYLTALGRFGVSTGMAATKFVVLGPDEVGKASGKDLLLIGGPDTDKLLASWGKGVPALLDGGKRSVRPAARALGAVEDIFALGAEDRVGSPEGLALLEGDGPLALLTGFESPLNTGRSVVALTATHPGAMQQVGDVLNDPGRIRRLRGDLGVFRSDQVESFRINDRYYVGDMPWWRQLWFFSHSSPILLALFSVGGGLLLAYMLYASLRAMANRRLGKS